MKITPHFCLFCISLAVLSLSISSCTSDEDLFAEIIADNKEIVETNDAPTDAPTEGDTQGTNTTDALKINDTPCKYSLNDVSANETLNIDCRLDLEGKTVMLSENVTLNFNGGEIINGTLNFASGGKIDGDLLNNKLEVSGAVTLTNEVFQFYKERWGIVEGEVSDAVAKTNGDFMNKAITLVKNLGVDTFKIDTIDAYFGLNTDDRKAYCIFVPSNFNLIMTDNTNLRVQPNGLKEYALLFSWEVDNVLISGGKLWGDRYTHDYNTTSSSHEWGHVIWFKAVHNGVVDNVEMHEGTGDGFYLSSSSDRNADGSLKPDRRESFNISVKNCLINDNRRNNISLVDGKDIFIEYNTIRNAGSTDGSPGVNSNSTSPSVAVIIESREQMAPDGNSLYTWEKVENVHIRHNIFEDNRADVVLLSGEKAFIYENAFRSERAVTVSAAVDGKVYNNTFESTTRLMDNSRAVFLESRYFANGDNRVKNYEVTNNTFTGYSYAILAGGEGHEIKDNTIKDCKRGIVLGSLKDVEIDNNIISSNISDSYGYFTFSGETSIKNIIIKNGATDVQGKELFFSDINNDEAGGITIDNIDFNGVISFISAQNITVKNSTFENISTTNCSPVLINNN